MAPPRPLAFLTLCLLLVAPLCSDDLDDPNAAVRAALQAELEDFSGPRWDERAAEPPGPALTDYRSRMARIAGSGGFLQGHRAGTLPLVRAGSLTEKLGVNVFLPQSPAPGSIAQGTLLFVHGYMSHSANFAYTFDFFTRRGWRVVTLDLPGHGLSTGTRADVDSFSEYGDAVRMWLDWVWSRDWPGPRILLAHSLGTSAALEALRRPGAPRPDKIVFGAPLLRPDWYPVLAVGEAALGWWLKRMPSTFGWDGYLDGQISDFGQWTDVAQREATYGMDYWTNVAATDVPPQVKEDPANPGFYFLQVNLANRRFYEDGVTLVQGTGRMRIPNSFLQMAYGIPNPATMTGSSLVGTLSGSGSGTVAVYQNPSGTAMMVDFDTVGFPAATTPHAKAAQAAATSSVRALRVKRGTIVPTRPRDVHARRVAAHRGKVLFDPASPRGARITGYQARCVRLNGTGPVVARASGSPVVVTGLARGRAYDCRVRATSKAGPGSWSSRVRLRATP